MFPSPTDADRGISPALGAVLLVGVTVLTASVVGTALLGQAAALGESSPTATFDVVAEGDRVSISHTGGDTVDVRALRVEVTVDGEPLDRQPPVPFFAARGFHGGPTGPFNPATDHEWDVGETASFRVAGTNEPGLEASGELTIELFYDDRRVASLSTRVGG